jgi:hypothetical protein
MSSIAKGDQLSFIVAFNPQCHHSRNKSDLFRTTTELPQRGMLAVLQAPALCAVHSMFCGLLHCNESMQKVGHCYQQNTPYFCYENQPGDEVLNKNQLPAYGKTEFKSVHILWGINA